MKTTYTLCMLRIIQPTEQSPESKVQHITTIFTESNMASAKPLLFYLLSRRAINNPMTNAKQ